MRPVYEGYFSKIEWIKMSAMEAERERRRRKGKKKHKKKTEEEEEEDEEEEEEDMFLNENFSGFWRITSRIGDDKMWRYGAVTNTTNQARARFEFSSKLCVKLFCFLNLDRLPRRSPPVEGDRPQVRPVPRDMDEPDAIKVQRGRIHLRGRVLH